MGDPDTDQPPNAPATTQGPKFPMGTDPATEQPRNAPATAQGPKSPRITIERLWCGRVAIHTLNPD